jgi:hypothetical protein
MPNFLYPRLERDLVREGIAENEKIRQELENQTLTIGFLQYLKKQKRDERRKMSTIDKVGSIWDPGSPMSEGHKKLQSLKNEDEE